MAVWAASHETTFEVGYTRENAYILFIFKLKQIWINITHSIKYFKTSNILHAYQSLSYHIKVEWEPLKWQSCPSLRAPAGLCPLTVRAAAYNLLHVMHSQKAGTFPAQSSCYVWHLSV